MDPAPVLASLPQPKGVRLVEEGMGINAPFPQSSRREAVGVEPSAAARQLSKPGVAALVLLFLAAVLWFVLPDDGTWNVMNVLSPADGGATPSAVSQAPADGNATSPSLEGAVAVMPVAASVSQDSSSTVSSPNLSLLRLWLLPRKRLWLPHRLKLLRWYRLRPRACSP